MGELGLPRIRGRERQSGAHASLTFLYIAPVFCLGGYIFASGYFVRYRLFVFVHSRWETSYCGLCFFTTVWLTTRWF